MIKRPIYFLSDIYDKRSILYELAKRDFQQQYLGSYLGFIWVFLQPFLYITILYLVFTFGFKAPPTSDDIPFSLFLISGMIPWLFFLQNFMGGTNVIRQHSFLLKKIDFRLSILPLVPLLSSALPHLFFIMVAIILAWAGGFSPSLYTLQIFYYFFAMLMLLLGLSWLTSSTNIFVKDVAKIVAVFSQFGFWLTPIFWNIETIPERYQWILKLNPMYYIVSGYRDSIINKIFFWERPLETLYFWSVTFVFMALGIVVFKKLRPHFAEVI
jgi:lipopolysaccharide transport system permease protein/teichoic acid transport system permease protein